MFKRMPELWLCIVLAIGVGVGLYFIPKSESVPVSAVRDASWTLYILADDNGCQYLTTSSDGGLTPRMDTDGKQICISKGNSINE